MYRAMSATVSGRVQGVMYRDFARRKAQMLGIVGEAKNLPDGTVAIWAEGEEEALTRFIAELKRGSLLARVKDVVLDYHGPRGTHTDFSIIHD